MLLVAKRPCLEESSGRGSARESVAWRNSIQSNKKSATTPADTRPDDMNTKGAPTPGWTDLLLLAHKRGRCCSLPHPPPSSDSPRAFWGPATAEKTIPMRPSLALGCRRRGVLLSSQKRSMRGSRVVIVMYVCPPDCRMAPWSTEAYTNPTPSLALAETD